MPVMRTTGSKPANKQQQKVEAQVIARWRGREVSKSERPSWLQKIVKLGSGEVSPGSSIRRFLTCIEDRGLSPRVSVTEEEMPTAFTERYQTLKGHATERLRQAELPEDLGEILKSEYKCIGNLDALYIYKISHEGVTYNIKVPKGEDRNAWGAIDGIDPTETNYELIRAPIVACSVAEHPNVMTVHGLAMCSVMGEEATALLMEHQEGARSILGDVDQDFAIRNREKEAEASRRIRNIQSAAIDIIAAVRHLHRNGLICDVRLGDFSLISRGAESFHLKLTIPDRAKDPRSIAGLPLYMGFQGKEGVYNKEEGTKQDAFAVGAALYTLSTGISIMPGAHNSRGLADIIRSIKESPLKYPERFPTLLKDLIDSLVLINPEERSSLSTAEQHPFFDM